MDVDQVEQDEKEYQNDDFPIVYVYPYRTRTFEEEEDYGVWVDWIGDSYRGYGW